MSRNDTMERGRARLVEIKSELDEITTRGFTSDGGQLVVQPEAKTRFRRLLNEGKEIQEHLSGVEDAAELGRFLDDPASGDAGTRQAAGTRDPAQFKSLGTQFLESAEFKSREGYRMREDFKIEGADLGSYWNPEGKDIYTGLAGRQERYSFGSTEQLPMVQRQMRTQRVRDLFPVATTTANLIQYIRTLGYLNGVNAARTVPERETIGGNTNFGLKPHTSLAFEPAEAPIRTIAHYEVAHRNILDDEPQLRSVIDGELMYGLRLAEDDQLLNGDGTGENILGLLRTPGIQTYPGSATPSPVQPGDTYLDAIRRAATRVWMAFYEPTGVVVHPFDWERMELTKDLNGQYIATVSVADGAQSRIWRLPVTATPAMNEGVALVGAFGLGAKVYDRQQGNIRVSDQHMDYFTRNAVAILAEERVGLVVPRPESLVMVNLPTSTRPATVIGS